MPDSILLKTIVVLCLLAGPVMADDVDFDALSGSDLGLGVGARAIGLGGAFSAVADDGSALFWNPAGMARMKTSQLFVSAGCPDTDEAFSLVVRPGEDFPLTFGVGRFVRLHFDGDSGQEDWSGYPAHLLDLSMIDVDETYSGQIKSDTFDYRFSVAGRLPYYDRLAWGVSFVKVK